MKASGIRPQASGLSEASGQRQETGLSWAGAAWGFPCPEGLSPRAFLSRLAALFMFVLASGCEQPRAASETAFVGPAPPVREALALPNRPGSIKFAAIGDA